MANICIAGLWHQATVVSACLADMGHSVFGVGDDEQVVASLNAAKPPVYEPKLETIIRRNLNAGRLTYTTDYYKALREAEFAFIAIDTPVGADDESDLSGIFESAQRIGRAAPERFILVITAQVPVGTCKQLAAIVREENPNTVFDVAYVPEFLRLGTAVDSFRRADRFVIGTDNPMAAKQIAELYRPLGRPMVITNLSTAEMAKHASNAFLATSISFINEMADLCDEVGADVSKVGQIMKLDQRIGKYAFLSPGLGFAGGTLGRELRVLQKLGQHHRRQTLLTDAVVDINQSRARLVGQRLQQTYGTLEGLRVGILGLTYKPGTSTLRRAISLDIIRDLNVHGASVKAYDPLARLEGSSDLPSFESCFDPYAAAQGSDALVLITEWAGIRNLDLPRLRAAMRRAVFIDTRNLFDPAEMQRVGFIYSGIGRGGQGNSSAQQMEFTLKEDR